MKICAVDIWKIIGLEQNLFCENIVGIWNIIQFEPCFVLPCLVTWETAFCSVIIHVPEKNISRTFSGSLVLQFCPPDRNSFSFGHSNKLPWFLVLYSMKSFSFSFTWHASWPTTLFRLTFLQPVKTHLKVFRFRVFQYVFSVFVVIAWLSLFVPPESVPGRVREARGFPQS